MKVISLEVTKTVRQPDGSNKRVRVGDINVPLFDLKDFGIYAEEAVYDEKEGTFHYSDAKANFVLQAVHAALKANARNALLPGTVTLKAGARIDSTIEEVLEAAQGRNGEALKAYREAVNAFISWLAAKSGKKQAVQALYASMAKSKAAIEVATTRAKEGFIAVVEAFAESLTAEEAERYSSALQKMVEAAAAEAELLDEDDF